MTMLFRYEELSKSVLDMCFTREHGGCEISVKDGDK